MSIIPIKRFLSAARSFVCTCDKSTDLIQEMQALLNDLLKNDRFSRLTEDNLKTALFALQECSDKLAITCKHSHKDITPSCDPHKKP